MSFRNYILKWLNADLVSIRNHESRISNLESSMHYAKISIDDVEDRQTTSENMEKILMDASTAQADLIASLTDSFNTQADGISAMEAAILKLQEGALAMGVDPAVVEAQAQAVLSATSAMKAEILKMKATLAALATPPTPAPSSASTDPGTPTGTNTPPS